MQQNNEEMQREMGGMREENQYLREYITDLEQEASAANSSSSKPPTIARSNSITPEVSRPQSVQMQMQQQQQRKSSRTRKTIATSSSQVCQPPTKKIKLRKTTIPTQGKTSLNSRASKQSADKADEAPSANQKSHARMTQSKRVSYITPRSSLNQGCHQRTSVGLLSQSKPYEMAPSSNDDTSPKLPIRN